jgi:hypothetical protein
MSRSGWVIPSPALGVADLPVADLPVADLPVED